ncbi:MAG: hypothetical protein WC005_02945 [Candidatus Nanopelagicales bacterium]
MQTAQLVKEASPIIGLVGGTYFFTDSTVARGKELGLDGMRFYYIGRGGVLGDTEWPVVVSAFGFFAPRMVEKFWDSARQTIEPRTAGHAYVECARDFGRENFTEVEGLAEYCAAAEKIVAAVDPAGLTLFAAHSAEPLAEDLPGRAAQLTTLLREHRGSAHLVALIAVGLEPRIADALASEVSWKFHGWTLDDGPAPTEGDRGLKLEAEAITDRIVQRAFGVLDDQEQQALLTGLQGMSHAMPGAWSLKDAPN